MKVFVFSILLVLLFNCSNGDRQGYVPVPYPAAGYRPFAPFVLPQRQQVPQAAYGSPSTEEPEATTTEAPEVEDIATESAFNSKDGNNNSKKDKLEEQETFEEQGVYYIYHPDGLLQRVVYTTKNNVEDMGYTARLTYKDVEPIKDPIYTYDAKTLAFSQISK